MSGALKIDVKPPMASPMSDQPEPWDTKDVNTEALRLQAVSQIQRMAREGKRAQSRQELAKLREKYKGTPAEAQIGFLMAADDYEGALDAHIKQLQAERLRGPEPIAAPPPDPEQQHAAWVGGGGPEITGDAAQEYAAANQTANDDADVASAFDAFNAEEAEAGRGPQQQDNAPELRAPAPGGAARSLEDLIRGGPKRPRMPSMTGDVATDATSILGDIGTGFAESPKAVVGGIRNGVDELLSSIDSAGAWVATQAMLAEGDKAGADKLAARRAAGETALGGQLPEVGDPRSATGKIVEGITQFVTGFVAGGKVLKASGTVGAFAKGAFADAFAFDPARYRLSNLIEENPALKNPVTDFLASKPGDSEAQGRLANALEGTGIGIAFQGVFMAALKGMRAVSALKPKPPTPEELTAHVREATAPLGDPNAPLLLKKPPPEAGQPAAGTPLTTTAEGKDVFINFARIDTPDDVKSLIQQTANLAKNGAPVAEGEIRAFHGSPRQFDKFDNAKIGTGEGYLDEGHGHYFTESEARAAQYRDDISAQRGAKGQGSVSEVRIRATADEIIDFERPFAEQPTKVQDALRKIDPKLDAVTETIGTTTRPAIGATLVKRISGSQKEVSAKLSAAGIKAARYKEYDGAHAGNVNYLVYDAGAVQKVGEGITAAQRGVQSQAATKQLADDMGMTVQDLLSRRRGPNGARTPFTAEEALAARKLFTASGEKLHELAQRATAPNAGEIDLFNLRKMMSTHLAIQNEVLGARTETARALASWRIEAGSGEAQLRAIRAMMETAGPDTQRMAQELVRLKHAGATPGALATYVRQSAIGTFGQGVREVFVNGLLSGPLTHIVNASGNLGTLGLSAVERAVARGISKHVTGSDAVAEGEASAMLHGMWEGQRDGLRAAWKATSDVPEDFLGKVDSPRVAAISSTRDDAFGKTINLIGATTRAPSLLMSASDQFFKAINYRAELHAMAAKTARDEGLTGKAFAERYRQVIDNPPQSIKLQASDQAFYNTFNSQAGWFGSTLLKLREGGGPMNAAWLVVPFIRTPVNIARYAFERTPLAPLVGQWREAFARGGRDRDIALSKVATGTMIMGLAQAGAENGYVSGALPTDGNEAALWGREGRQPYSVKIGDTWYSYNRADPFGMTMGFAADIQNTLSRGDVSPKDVDEWQEVMAGGIAAIADTATDKTFMRGFSQFNDMLSDPKRYATKEINQVITGFVPFTSLAGWANRLNDPTVRDARTPLDAISARIPGLADRIIPKRDLWGEVKSDPLTLENSFNPLRASKQAASPIDAELDRLQVYPDGIGWKASINGTAVNFSDYPKALDEYRRLAGNGWKHPAWGVGLKDFLDQTVSGEGQMSRVYEMFSDGDQGGKAGFIRKAIQDYREGAARELLSDPRFADFQSYYEGERQIQREGRQKIALPTN